MNKPNILFLTKSLGIGGVEVVTVTLAKEFAKHGCSVGLFCFFMSDKNVLGMLPDDIPAFVGHGYKDSRENVETLRRILIERNINIIINQWGLPFLPIRVINKARSGLDIKVISVYHNQVDTNGKLKACDQAIERCTNPLLGAVLRFKRWGVKLITSRSMRYVYNHSDLYEVLSPSFIEIFKTFTGIKNPTKLISQTNPITIESNAGGEEVSLDNLSKKNEIIYVGRLDFVQKRVYRVIDTWNYLEERFPDWRLTIVGDGEDRVNLENHVNALGLKRVTFEGFQNPLEYYKRAKLLLLTSDFEGFGLVIVEGMSYGVIPFVYGSYPAIYDIVTSEKDGYILPMTEKGYDAESMANRMAEIMERPDTYRTMAEAAMEKSKRFSLDSIYQQWSSEFVKIKLGGNSSTL